MLLTPSALLAIWLAGLQAALISSLSDHSYQRRSLGQRDIEDDAEGSTSRIFARDGIIRARSPMNVDEPESSSSSDKSLDPAEPRMMREINLNTPQRHDTSQGHSMQLRHRERRMDDSAMKGYQRGGRPRRDSGPDSLYGFSSEPSAHRVFGGKADDTAMAQSRQQDPSRMPQGQGYSHVAQRQGSQKLTKSVDPFPDSKPPHLDHRMHGGQGFPGLGAQHSNPVSLAPLSLSHPNPFTRSAQHLSPQEISPQRPSRSVFNPQQQLVDHRRFIDDMRVLNQHGGREFNLRNQDQFVRDLHAMQIHHGLSNEHSQHGSVEAMNLEHGHSEQYTRELMHHLPTHRELMGLRPIRRPYGPFQDASVTRLTGQGKQEAFGPRIALHKEMDAMRRAIKEGESYRINPRAGEAYEWFREMRNLPTKKARQMAYPYAVGRIMERKQQVVTENDARRRETEETRRQVASAMNGIQALSLSNPSSRERSENWMLARGITLPSFMQGGLHAPHDVLSRPVGEKRERRPMSNGSTSPEHKDAKMDDST